MKDKMKGIAVAAVAAVALAVGGAAVAGAAGNDPAPEQEFAGEYAAENETPIGGGALDKASAAALETTAGGSVTETEVGDEESYYEVEVTLDDGSQTDVQLDRDFNVVGQGADGEE